MNGREKWGIWVRRLLMLTIGIVIAQAGVQLFVAVRLGSDPFMVFVQGIALLLRCALIVAACIITSFGLSIMLQSAAGVSPGDLLAVVLTDRIKRLEFRWARIGTDLCLLTVGALLGGTVGIGTVLSACMYGPVVQRFTPFAKAMAGAMRVNSTQAGQKAASA